MRRKKIPEKISQWLQCIEDIWVTDPEETIQYCNKLEEYADETKSDYLKGYSLFHKGYCNYWLNRPEEGVAHLSVAINCLIRAEEWVLVARSYNALGNIADFQGDLSLAIDCYFKGLSCSREHNLDNISFYLESNLANIYLALGEPGNAEPKLLSCEKKLEKCEFTRSAKTILYANLTNCYILLNKLDTAERYLELLKKESEENRDLLEQISVLCLETEIYNAKGDLAARDRAITELQNTEFTTIVVFDALNELCSHAMRLLEIENYEAFLKLVDQIDSLAEGTNVKKKTSRLRLKYYKKIGDEENCTKMALLYFEIVEQQEKQQNKIISHNILTRANLEEEAERRKEIEKTNLMLKRKSEKDALTGMNNRYKLNELSELAFHKAYMDGAPLSVEILDIDYFKEYNDHYGHQAGDECLIKIANAIQSMEEFDGVHTGRYGGDEFLIIYEGYEIDDVKRLVERLRTMIHEMNIEHKYSKASDRVTISQGIFHKIPVSGNKLWDFLYSADMALYAVKRKTRDSYYLSGSLKEIRAQSQLLENAN